MKLSSNTPIGPMLGLLTVSCLLAACGGGGGGSSAPASASLPTEISGAASALEATASSPESQAAAASAAEAASAAVATTAASAPKTAAAPQPEPGSAAPPKTTGTTPPGKTGGSPSVATGGTVPQVDIGAVPAASAVAGTAEATPAVAAQEVTPPLEAGPSAKAASVTPPPCVIKQRRYFAGSCWAEIDATIPNGSNRSFPNVRLNHRGSVNASCISSKVSWTSGTCDSDLNLSQAAPPPMGAPTVNYKIGTYYFPGWRNYQAGSPAPLPWERIKAFPEREPMLGWYDDGSVATVEQQLKWMKAYGIDYVVFDWYWNGKASELEHAVKAYWQTTSKRDVPYALLWASHGGVVPRNKAEFITMVAHWLVHHFNRPEYLRIDDKPVIFMFSHPHFVKQAARLGQSYTSLLKEAEDLARKAGYKGIYFVGGTHVDSSVVKVAATSGYSAFSTYNYHGRADDVSSSYRELDDSYRYVWDWITTTSAIPYIVPMTQGWDRRPWGPSSNPLHDLSGGNPTGFLGHLEAARRLMDAKPSKTMRMGIICCWNEFGEGSIIEPTKRNGFTYLEQVRKVFGTTIPN